MTGLTELVEGEMPGDTKGAGPGGRPQRRTGIDGPIRINRFGAGRHRVRTPADHDHRVMNEAPP